MICHICQEPMTALDRAVCATNDSPGDPEPAKFFFEAGDAFVCSKGHVRGFPAITQGGRPRLSSLDDLS
jgi:hypothetical protein